MSSAQDLSSTLNSQSRECLGFRNYTALLAHKQIVEYTETSRAPCTQTNSDHISTNTVRDQLFIVVALKQSCEKHSYFVQAINMLCMPVIRRISTNLVTYIYIETKTYCIAPIICTCRVTMEGRKESGW